MTARLRLSRRNVPLSGPRVVPAGVSPLPFLVEEKAEWRAAEIRAHRAALVAEVSSSSAALVADRKDAACDRWPSPTRKRR